MNAIGLNVERMLSSAAIGGTEAMPPSDPLMQYGPAGILLLAFSGAITVLWRWGSPLVADWVKSRIALTDAVRKSHEETAAANSIRFEQIQKHFEHVDGRVDKIYEVIKHNCGKGLLESDSEMKSPTGAAK